MAVHRRLDDAANDPPVTRDYGADVPHFAVTAVGADRPGIVAAVTGVLVDAGCNLEDTSMTILRGHFAMMLVLAGPAGLDATDLEAALATATSELDLVLTARAIDDTVPESPAGDPWRATVHGADRPGIVHRVSALLAERGVNVVDLSTRLVGEPDDATYVMVLDLSLPASVDPDELRVGLAGLASEVGVSATLHPADPDIL